jgi:hypothetical protein
MKILKTSILFFAFFIGSICYSQEKDIDNIIFEYNSFLGIPFNSVKIQIYKTVDGKSAFAFVQSETENDDSESQYSKIDASYDIDIEKFNNLIMKVVFLEKIDLDKAYLDGTDASTCKIEFGAKGRNISYEFWEPKFETKERGLNLFVELCEEILTLFKLNPKEFLDK